MTNIISLVYNKASIPILLLLLTTTNLSAQNCTINAGVTTTICVGQNFTFNGNISGASDPNTITWLVVNQPAGANVVFANPKSLYATAGSSVVAGNYTFRLSAVCGDGTPVFNDVSYVVNPVPSVPSITGTFTYPCYNGSPINITGTAPAPGQTVMWRVSGSNTGVFSAPTSNTGTFTPTFNPTECAATTIFVLTYTVTNASGCQSTVSQGYSFQRTYPFGATAYPLTVCGTNTVLKGSCAGNGTSLWTVISKPAGAPDPTIAAPASNNTNAAGLVSGTYIFRYTVTGGCSPGTTDVTVNVAGNGTVSTANAGIDQYYCTVPSVVSVTGNKPAVGETGTWAQLLGGTATSIAGTTSANTTITGLTDAGAPYAFTYTISNGVCSSLDTVFIYKLATPVLTARDTILCDNNIPFIEAVTFGNYYKNSIDTVKVSTTFISGPAGAFVPILSRKLYGGGGTPNSYGGTLAVGQTIAWTISGDDLYLSPGGTSNSYVLDEVFRPSLVGTYRFKVAYSTKCNTYEKEFIITRGIIGLAVNAGTDVNLPCNATTITLAGNLNNGIGLWRTTQMPAGATNPINGTNSILRNPPLAGLIPGTYLFRYSSNNGPSCGQSTYDDIKVVVANAAPPVPNAGADKTTCAGTTTLNGTAIPAGVLGSWQIISPVASGVTFNDATLASPTLYNLQPNVVYTFRYTFTNGCGSSFDDVVVTTTANNTPVKPDITNNGNTRCSIQNGTLPATNLQLLINHTAFTAGAGVDSSWSVTTYPPVAAFTNVSTSTTRNTFTFPSVPASTIFTFVYRLSNPSCPTEFVSDTVSVVYWKTGEQIHSVGAPQQLCAATSFPVTATLTGSAESLPFLWTNTFSSAAQQPVIANPNSAVTTVSLPASGLYTFNYKLVNPIDAACNFNADLFTQIIVSSPGSIALAGNDISFCNASGTTNLNATPLATGTGLWQVQSIVNGTAPTITTPASPTTAINFSQSGTVILKWNSYGTVAECGPSSSDLLQVTYVAPARAGNDQQLCASTSANLNALSAAPNNGTWTQVAGPNTAGISSATSNQTIVTGLITGTYTFRWSVSAGACSSTDDVNIVVSNSNETANAGPDAVSCFGGTNVIQLNATAAPAGFTGTWTLISKPSGAIVGSFADIHDPASKYNGVDITGRYVFAWTISNGTCSSVDYVEINAIGTGCTLPVELAVFYATVKDCSVALRWESATEQNVLKYVIEKSLDGTEYVFVNEIAAGGNSNTRQEYNYTDKDITSNKYYYRLKMMDVDGSFKYSGIVNTLLRCNGYSSLSVVPNPAVANGNLKVRIVTEKYISKGMLTIISITGQIVSRYPVVLNTGLNLIDYPATTIAAGTYIVELRDNNQFVSKTKLIIQ